MSERQLFDCKAPAKLNLFLHVLGRKPNGYHQLQTVFQLLDRHDVLHFEWRSDGLIRRTNPIPGVPEELDLTVRAAKLLQSQCAPSQPLPGVDITLEKNLPLGGGLGGGSSDAATTFIALNRLWQLNLSKEQLMALSLPLGADIPFFIFGHNAFAEGVGEVLTRIDTPNAYYVVVEPGVNIPTATIFSANDLTRDTKPVKITDFAATHSIQCGFGRNDLQAVAARLFPQVAAALDWLGAYGDARMSGSGASVFCAFPDRPSAEAVAKAVLPPWRAWVAAAMTQHPLHAWLD